MDCRTALVPPLELNDYHPDLWNMWFTKFKVHTVTTSFSKLSDAEKVGILLLNLGHDVTHIFLTFGVDVDSVSYQELVRCFTSYFHPLKARNVFFNSKQKSGESFNHFANRLRILIFACGFGPGQDKILRDIFLCNLEEKYSHIRAKILDTYIDPDLKTVVSHANELLMKVCSLGDGVINKIDYKGGFSDTRPQDGRDGAQFNTSQDQVSNDKRHNRRSYSPPRGQRRGNGSTPFPSLPVINSGDIMDVKVLYRRSNEAVVWPVNLEEERYQFFDLFNNTLRKSQSKVAVEKGKRVAVFHKRHWYRVLVLSIKDSRASVESIDFGWRNGFDLSEFCMIPLDFSGVDPLALTVNFLEDPGMNLKSGDRARLVFVDCEQKIWNVRLADNKSENEKWKSYQKSENSDRQKETSRYQDSRRSSNSQDDQEINPTVHRMFQNYKSAVSSHSECTFSSYDEYDTGTETNTDDSKRTASTSGKLKEKMSIDQQNRPGMKNNLLQNRSGYVRNNRNAGMDNDKKNFEEEGDDKQKNRRIDSTTKNKRIQEQCTATTNSKRRGNEEKSGVSNRSDGNVEFGNKINGLKETNNLQAQQQNRRRSEDVNVPNAIKNQNDEPPIEMNKFCRVVVVHPIDDQTAFVYPETSKKEFEDLFEYLQESYRSGEKRKPLNTPKVGMYCAAPFEGDYYRAEILEIRESKARVLFYDFGNVDHVPTNELWKLPQSLAFPSLSFPIKIPGNYSFRDIKPMGVVEVKLKVKKEQFWVVDVRKWQEEEEPCIDADRVSKEEPMKKSSQEGTRLGLSQLSHSHDVEPAIVAGRVPKGEPMMKSSRGGTRSDSSHSSQHSNSHDVEPTIVAGRVRGSTRSDSSHSSQHSNSHDVEPANSAGRVPKVDMVKPSRGSTRSDSSHSSQHSNSHDVEPANSAGRVPKVDMVKPSRGSTRSDSSHSSQHSNSQEVKSSRGGTRSNLASHSLSDHGLHSVPSTSKLLVRPVDPTPMRSPKPPIPKNEFSAVRVVYTGAEGIFVVPAVDLPAMSDLFEAVKKAAKDARPCSTPAILNVYAAPFDGDLYRAQVLSINRQEDSCRVKFMDFGNQCEVSTSDLLDLPPHLTKPVFAFQIRLDTDCDVVVEELADISISPVTLEADGCWLVQVEGERLIPDYQLPDPEEDVVDDPDSFIGFTRKP